MPFADLHCDTVSRLLACRRREEEAGLGRPSGGHVSLEELREGDYCLQAFALFVDLEKAGDPWAEAMAQAALFREELEKNRDLAVPVKTFAEMEAARRAGKIACLLTVEEGGICGGDLNRLRTLRAMGARLMTLTWNYPNELAWPNGQAGGLTETGLAVLEEMEALGVIPDVSHLGDEGFRDLCRAAKKPFLASHSCCRELWDHRRNLTDEMIRALADRGGIVGVNYYAPFLGPDPVSRPEAIVRHLRHLIRVGGLETAALGSDFDGIDCALSWGAARESGALLRAMEAAGFTSREIEAVTWGNVWRFFRENL